MQESDRVSDSDIISSDPGLEEGLVDSDELEKEGLTGEIIETLETRFEADRVADMVLQLRRQKELEGRLHGRIERLESRLRETQRILREMLVRFLSSETPSGETDHTEDILSRIGLDTRYQAGLGILLYQPGVRGKAVAEGVVDCESRLHVCRGACCTLGFALTAEEVEAGGIEWDSDKPFYIRKDERGFCVHRDSETGRCLVYDHRPAICREYSCEKDGKMWADFKAMEPGPRILNQLKVMKGK